MLHVPDLSSTLMSVRQISEKKFTMAFDDEKCIILTPKGRIIGEGKRHGNLYVLVGEVIVPQVDPQLNSKPRMLLLGRTETFGTIGLGISENEC